MPQNDQQRETSVTGDAALRYLETKLGWPIEELRAFPKFVCLDPTNQCNARCVMCGIDFRKVKPACMTDELFDKIVDELAGHAEQIERVALFVMCEPLMDPHLDRKIAKLKEIGIKCVHLNSNGSLLFASRARQLIRAGLDRIYISIDSMDPATYESIRLGLKFEQVYGNILDFIKIRDELNPDLVLRVQMILQEANFDEAGAFVEHWRGKVGPKDQVVVTRAFNWGDVHDAELPGDDEDVNRIPCIALWSTLEILANGDVRLCCVDVDGAVDLGNVRDQSIDEIWHGPELAKARQMHVRGARGQIPICDHCTVWMESKHETPP